MPEQTLETVLNEFRALGEETRLRIVLVLARGELTVSELTHILQQSQPRVSRHVNILAEAGVLQRHREGAWVFYRLDRTGVTVSALEERLGALVAADKGVFAEDMVRLNEVRARRAEAAAKFFQKNADRWERLRRLHLPESDIEQAMRDLVGDDPVGNFVDLGTGTGRMLIVFKDLYRAGVGYDLSPEMLSIARSYLEEEGLDKAHVQQSDLFTVDATAPPADLVCIHQVLHYLSDPGAAIGVARDILAPGGRILIADFAAHDLEFLREDYAHHRLGFSDAEVRRWAGAAGLTVAAMNTLEPEDRQSDRLTVKLWLLADPVGHPETATRKEVLNV